MTERFALYYAPPAASGLARFGAAWLGRDPQTDQDVELLPIEGMSRDCRFDIVRQARGYGFHATLKPPFALASGTTWQALEAATGELAEVVASFDAPPLDVASLDGFLALMFTSPCTAMDDLAARCVTELDRFRAPPCDRERQLRAASGLSQREEMLLDRWGYPWVMERFCFHMTLTRRLDRCRRKQITAALEVPLAPLLSRCWHVDGICIFHQEARDRPFRILRRFPLTG